MKLENLTNINTWLYLKKIGNRCIPATWRCDHTVDCPDKSDEDKILCSAKEESKKTCESYEFRCVSNGECIPRYWLCDEMSDCMDRSDENATVCQKLHMGNSTINDAEKGRYKKNLLLPCIIKCIKTCKGFLQ